MIVYYIHARCDDEIFINKQIEKSDPGQLEQLFGIKKYFKQI